MYNFLLFLIIIFTSTNTYAHQTGLSYIQITEDNSHKIKVVYKKPLEDKNIQDIKIKYPSRCIKNLTSISETHNGFIINKYNLWCGVVGLNKSTIWIEGLVRDDRGVIVKYSSNDIKTSSLLRANSPFIKIVNNDSNIFIFKEYTQLGISHILSGYDHLSFVLLILILANSKKTLFYSISGFTLSHSITLFFGIFNIIFINIAYVESMIALSIIFLAKELLIEDSNTFTKSNLTVVAFIFGLLHGFGFSSVLKNIGLVHENIATSIFSFNLGIELGQIIFIVVANIAIYIFQKFISINENLLKKLIAYTIGSIASLWFFQRVLSF